MNREEIINDLIRNRPEGPPGFTVKYTVENSYDYDRSRYRDFVTPCDELYGYTHEDLFDLGFKSKNEVDYYFRARDFDGKGDWSLGGRKATLTRRVYRLWTRIGDSVQRVERAGGRGIYKVRSSSYSSSSLGHLYAETKDEAQITAKIYFGYLTDDADRIRVDFVRRGSVSEMKELNEEMVKEIDIQIARQEQEAVNLQKRIANLKARKDTLATVESQQKAVEMVNTLSAMEG